MASHALDYDSAPSVNPAGAPGNDFERIDARPEQFGALTARALGTVGSGLEKASEEGFSVATQQAQMDARTHAAELHSWQSDQTTDATEKFLSLRGKAAEMARPAYKEQIEQIHNDALSQADNPFTKQLVNSEGRGLIDRNYALAARHAGSQKAVYESNTAKDAAASYGNSAVLYATNSAAPAIADDDSVQQSLFNSDQEKRNHASLDGYEGPAIEQQVAANRGKNVENIIKTIAGDGSPTGLKRAFDFFKSQEDKIDAGSRVQIQNFLKGPLNTVAGQARADEEMGRPPSRTPPEIIADVPANFIGGIKQSEGYSPKAKWDFKQDTNGFGTKAKYPGEVIDVQTANARFNEAITKAAKYVDSVNPNLDPGTRAALTSLTFNAGETWGSSGLGDKIRSGDISGAKESFLQYNKAGGETNEGLVMRRAREASWFGRGDITPVEASAPREGKGNVMLRIMDDPDLINRPQVQAAALQHVNKIYEAYHLQQSQDKSAFTVKLQNSSAEALDTGAVQQPIGHEEFIAGLGPEAGEAAYQDYQKTIQLGSDLRSTASLSPEGIGELYKKYQPQPGGDYVGQSLRQKELDKAITQNEAAKKKDPAEFVISRTDSGKAAYNQYQTLSNAKDATPEQKKTYAAMFADKMIAEQIRLGVDPADARVVPKWYTDDLNKRLADPQSSGGAQGVAAILQHEADLWGDHWPDIYRQMAPDSQPIIRVIGSGIKPEASTALINSFKTKEGDLLKNEDDPTDTMKNITAAVDRNMSPFYSSLSGDKQNQTKTDFRTMATRLATIYLQNNTGMQGESGAMGSSNVKGNVEAASAKAVSDLVGYKYDFKNTYRVPKDAGVSADAVQAGAVAAREMLGKPGLEIASKRDDVGGLSDEYRATNTASSLRRNGVWLTDPKEKGLVLVQGNGNAVARPDGTAFTLTWKQLGDLAAARKASQNTQSDLAGNPI